MEKKNKSFALISMFLIVMVALMGAITAVVYYKATANLYQSVNLIFLLFFGILLLLIIFAVFGMYMVYLGKGNKVLYFFANKGMRTLFPIYETAASIFGMKKDEIRAFYIRINNTIINKSCRKYKKEDVLIILPHCIQDAGCQLKVTGDINTCKKCGKCTIKDVTEITEEYGLNALVATGGTSARNAVKKFKPKFILSVACERDLSAGIADVNTIPVIGIVNKRPNGPCYNTTFDTEELREAIARFVEKEGK